VSYLLAALVVLVVLGLVAAAVVALVLRWAQRRGLLRRARLRVQVEGASVGVRRQLAQCELDLDRALADADQAVGAIGGSGASVDELQLLVAQLDQIGGRLRVQLQSLTRMGDRNLERMLPPVAASVDQVREISDRLAGAAGATMGGAAGSELHALTAGASDAIAVLDQRLVTLRELE
jgi:predicted PurR-regulated permease PerM